MSRRLCWRIVLNEIKENSTVDEKKDVAIGERPKDRNSLSHLAEKTGFTPQVIEKLSADKTKKILLPNNNLPAPNYAQKAIEISNGNGVTGMAGRSAEYLRGYGFNVGRITNAENFRFQESIIYYRDGYLPVAQRARGNYPRGSKPEKGRFIFKSINWGKSSFGQRSGWQPFSRRISRQLQSSTSKRRASFDLDNKCFPTCSAIIRNHGILSIMNSESIISIWQDNFLSHQLGTAAKLFVMIVAGVFLSGCSAFQSNTGADVDRQIELQQIQQDLLSEPAVVETRTVAEYEQLGDGYILRGDVNRAYVYYMKGLELEPNNLSLLHKQGDLLLKKKKYAEAEPVYRKLLSMDGNDELALEGLGKSYFGQEKYLEAETGISRCPCHKT